MLKHFTYHEKQLWNCLMIILKLHLKVSTKLYGEGRLFDLAMLLKILTPKQMFQRLPIALAQVKAGNISENVLN